MTFRISKMCSNQFFVYQVPSREVDKSEQKFWTHWNQDTKQFFLQFAYKVESSKPMAPIPPPPPPPPISQIRTGPGVLPPPPPALHPPAGLHPPSALFNPVPPPPQLSRGLSINPVPPPPAISTR